MTQIGKYEVVRRTGETPLGTVYEAFDPVLSRKVSIQTSGEEEGADASPRRQTAQIALQKGGESLGRLNHPNIRNVIATEEADGTIYLVMEHLTAQPIDESVSTGRLAPASVLNLLKMAAAALDHAHAHQIAHPGLTPKQLLVDQAGLLKVAGFEMSGMQEMPEEQLVENDLETLLDSVRYRAPEFLMGNTNDLRSDQLSLASIALELISGRGVFEGPSPLQVMASILAGELPDISAFSEPVPGAARRVFERALAGDPAARYGSCAEMISALETALLRRQSAPARVTPEPENKAARLTRPPEKTTASSRLAEELAGTRRRNSQRLKYVLIALGVTVAAMAGMIWLELRPSKITNAPVEAVAPRPAPPHADSDRRIEDIAKKVAEQSATNAQPPVQTVAADTAKPRRAGKATQPKKTKKETPDLDMGEVRVGR